MPNTLEFTGNAVTYLGLIGVSSTLITLVAVFKSFGNSPLRR